MRGTHRKLWAVSALASAALLFAGCKSDSRDPEEIPRVQVGGGKYGPVGEYPANANNAQTGAGRSGDVSGTGGSGMAPADQPATGGSGTTGSQSTGTQGQGVTGADKIDEGGHTPSGGVPAPSGN